MKDVLITGGSGFIGWHLVRKLLMENKDVKVRTISRSESDILRMLTECPTENLVPIIGDIKELGTLEHALKDVDTVVHLAAMKHIDFCQHYPGEAIATNVDATKNMLELFEGTTFIGMSTDKAVQATNCYGATKLLMETLVLNKAKEDSNKRHIIIRSGNIFGSTGSVLDKWRQQIKQRNAMTITNTDMTRFFINVGVLVDYILEIVDKGENGKIYIPYQKALTLGDLVQAFVETYGDGHVKTETMNMRPGERMHEILLAEGEEQVVSNLESRNSKDAPKITVEEIKLWLRELEG